MVEKTKQIETKWLHK